MLTVELCYECITHSFLIAKCRITEYFSGYIVNIVKHVTKHDTGHHQAVHSPSLEESILNTVADRPESSTRAVAHHVSVCHQTVCRVEQKSLTPPPFSASTSFEFGGLSSPTAICTINSGPPCRLAFRWSRDFRSGKSSIDNRLRLGQANMAVTKESVADMGHL
ncbi:hypothetical protein TNCV_4107531 [Trichonephila clavipes]|nr:hypothetical protein TNCV_4107531 [Trichonephila clavipes]